MPNFLEGLRPPRPLMPDLFISFIQAITVRLTGINIYKFMWISQYEDRVFFSALVFDNQGKEVHIDSRTSDAIVLAIRANAPIYITPKIMDEVSIAIEDDDWSEELENAELKKGKLSYEEMNLESLQKNLNIMAEDYEKASFLRDLINRRQT
jgi:bifunctional DNase/RNase